MTDRTALPARTGQSNAPQESVRSHILVVFVKDQHGAIDRIIGLFRRRRANAQKITIGKSELPNVVRITVVMQDSEVAVHYLIEQLRKVVDVRHVVNLPTEQAVARELALIKVNSTPTNFSEIIELGHLFGAHTVDVGQGTVTLEVTGSEEKIEKLVGLLQNYGIREVARTGCVAISRDS